MKTDDLPIPKHFNPDKTGEVWRVAYQERAKEAEAWAKRHDIQPASGDRCKICLLAVDVQNTLLHSRIRIICWGTLRQRGDG